MQTIDPLKALLLSTADPQKLNLGISTPVPLEARVRVRRFGLNHPVHQLIGTSTSALNPKGLQWMGGQDQLRHDPKERGGTAQTTPLSCALIQIS